VAPELELLPLELLEDELDDELLLELELLLDDEDELE
jgi:hypothetical protein